MCASCGCGSPEEQHGDARNITWSQIKAAAEAGGQTPDEVVRNMARMAQQQGS